MGAPEGVGIEAGVEFFESAVVGGAFDVASDDRDEAILDGGEDEVFGVDEQQALLRFYEQLGGLRGAACAPVRAG